ncbi:GntR family transcriptional regulator [Streptomyces sp. MK37H]|uniref:GntR family transcriptional regulator n=1 Tax=Streptomyces sp. MK37H TaxID=2699117 RepID=UPI001B36FDB8|nr:GntR family transcriptional regulator [Streptomyces sp. MK37H]MBP8533700.1 GntR family transcriptional regulator [Streptomyces sp. MK37H]
MIADALRKEIGEGRIAAALPSEAQLMRDHGVSRTTIRRALTLLQDEGLIHSVPGAGRAVSGTADQRPLVERMTELITATSLAIGDAYPSELLEALQLRQGYESRTRHASHRDDVAHRVGTTPGLGSI